LDSLFYASPANDINQNWRDSLLGKHSNEARVGEDRPSGLLAIYAKYKADTATNVADMHFFSSPSAQMGHRATRLDGSNDPLPLTEVRFGVVMYFYKFWAE
jgi:hypothetical protein